MRDTTNGLLKFITCGSVDDGKSTLIGHILYDSKLLYADQEQALLLDSRVGSRKGKIDYSLLLDGLMAEREQGITIDVAYRYFTTHARSFIVADTPGHEEYTRNMAVGASFADLAVILTDATQGILPQTRRHARICSLMGIKCFVFAVNKMDLAGYAQDRYQKISDEIAVLCEELGIRDFICIPVSATEGDNVTRRSEQMPWYHGPVLLSYLESVNVRGGKPEEGFYLPIQRVTRPDYRFRGFQGQIEAGELHRGEQITVLPSGESAAVQALYIGDRPAESAAVGQPVTVQLDREVDISRGCVLVRDVEVPVAKNFYATLLWMDDMALSSGRDFWMKLGTKRIPAVVAEICYRIEIHDGTHQPAQTAEKNEMVRCRMVLSEPVVLDEFRRHKTLGELILIDRVTHATAACGVVESIPQQEQNETILTDGKQHARVGLFDIFAYHAELGAVLRHSAPPAVYRTGEALPLQGAGFAYPENLDIQTKTESYARVRGGAFAGFGAHEESIPVVNEDGIALQQGLPQSFAAYRTVVVGENHDEI